MSSRRTKDVFSFWLIGENRILTFLMKFISDVFHIWLDNLGKLYSWQCNSKITLCQARGDGSILFLTLGSPCNSNERKWERGTKPRRDKRCTVQLFTTQWLMPSPSPSSYPEQDALWYEISLWPGRVSCPGHAASLLRVPSSLAEHENW